MVACHSFYHSKTFVSCTATIVESRELATRLRTASLEYGQGMIMMAPATYS
jgi:hypothetical protein